MVGIIIAVVFVCVLIIGAVVFTMVYTSKKRALQIEEYKNNQYRINNKCLTLLKEKGFTATKVFYIPDNITRDAENEYKKLMLINSKDKKLAFIDYKTEQEYICDFKDLMKYDIYNNEVSRTSGTISGFGGGFFNNTSNNYSGFNNQSFGTMTTATNQVINTETSLYCTELKLNINLDNFDCPQITYDIISKQTSREGISKKSKAYSVLMGSLNELTSFLDVIIKNK